MDRRTILSPCRTYRYALWREWGGGLFGDDRGFALVIGLNPSTADETHDDPTIRRCVAFAKDWGYSALCMANLFAYRATDPADMRLAPDPIGPDNDAHLRRLAAVASVVVAAWGCGGDYRGRADAVRALIPGMCCLRLTKHGHPQHPLYLPKTCRPVAFDAARPAAP